SAATQITRTDPEAGISKSTAPSARSRTGPEWQNWIDNLRAAGVSEKVLAGLVNSDFENRWRIKLREVEKQFQDGEIDSDAVVRANQDHDIELEKEMRAALGEEGFRRWDKEKWLAEFDLT